ncbi:MAG: 50S ribosomal protein L16 [Microgenomates group bacterium GW2011_GWC1_41_8]|uniref:Large ribosomal subunit protein uL16 n=3 Tax=Candidatus Roizmaniibacteriota TaxID=1752723 RepID=A0A0G0X398_9BACT|nr:MAG: 50S ribosomal protein L16 [Candidatus Roizmanbacteria bacterium GW2011_GWB1_40_7]KKR94560.1 MAG: 50S ribosomal protein L16 [Candidatus Roizmanbacteria bacterium GW2011_GWA1_41_13]KKS19480.1 MAG: 50S ribosomal protein L16 [Candidatus Roizmanbacteria bacterium GW2011_GWC2_41_7]KKS24248.1 MAG: 50S ribosomal protein L16 [Microgenomates group bacterium GW2011_GWC1_41_8]OGK48420.1 MAG: 50S ribosomal protein L16 [Candidatus Roizmanbacteria bacterium RIFCSPLOWO2_01_FULL_40_14]
MLQPKRQKHRKQFRGKMPGNASRGMNVSFGEMGLKALECGWITANQIEAARVAISRRTRKGGKLWIRIFPDKPISGKPNETGMGGGKGDIVNYVAVIQPGRVLFEVGGLDDAILLDALRQAGHKMPIKTKIVSKE